MKKRMITPLLCMIILVCPVVMGAYYDNPSTYLSYDEFDGIAVNYSHFYLYNEGLEAGKWTESLGLLNAIAGVAGATSLSTNDNDAGVGANGNVKGVNFTFNVNSVIQDGNGNNVRLLVSDARDYGTLEWIVFDLVVDTDPANVSVYWNATNEFYVEHNGVWKYSYTGLASSEYYLRFNHQPGGGAPTAYTIDWLRIQYTPPPDNPPVITWNALNPANNTIYNTNINFNFALTDGTNPTNNCSLFEDSEGLIGELASPTTGSYAITYNLTTDGTKIFYVECISSTGQIGYSESNKTVLIDSANPTITWNNPSNNNSTFMPYGNNRFNITITDNNLYRINITCSKLNGDILFNNYTDAWTSDTYIFNEEVNVNEAGNYTCEVDSTDSHTGKIIGEIDTKKGNDYVQVGDVKLSMTGSTATTITKKSDRYSIEMQTANADLKQKTYTLKLESTKNNEVVIPKNTGYKGHILIFDKNNPMSGMWFDTEPYDSTINLDGKVATITIKTTDNTLRFNSIGILNNITEYASFSAYGNVDTGYAKNPTGNYYLFGNVTPSIAFSEVRWTVQNQLGTLTLNAQNSSSYDGITWNSSSITPSEEGVYNWTAEAYEGGQLWSTGTGSFTTNFTNITWSIANTPDTCTTLRYRFTAFDEQSRGITNFSMKTSFVIISGIAPNNAYNTTIDYNINNVGDVQLCIDSPDTDVFKLTAMTEYYGDVENGTHSTSNYYITNVQSSTPEVNFTMGMLPTNSTALVLLKVIDNAQTALQDYTIYVQKYYVEDNSYQLVRMAKTNDNGEDIIPLEFYNAWYRFLVYDTSQNLVYIGSNTKVYSGTLTITISPSTITQTLNQFKLITTSLTYTNNTDTGTFTLIYSDGSGAAQTVCLAVHRQTISVYETACESCLTSASGTIYCTINNTLEGTYTANAYATINPSWLLDSETITIITDFVRETFKTKIGKEGLLWTIALALTVALAFGFNPVAGIIAFLITLIAAAIMGLISVSYGAMAVLAIIRKSVV